jgi:hypothetical protein
MAIYTTIFAATEADLRELFPGWSSPLAEPLLEQQINPFTKQPMMVKSWVPRASTDPGRAVDLSQLYESAAPILAPVVPPEGEFSGYAITLEERAPRALRALPHASFKNVLGTHLLAIACAVGVESDGQPARVGPDGTQLDCLPRAAVSALAGLAEGELPNLAERLVDEGFDDVGGADDVLRILRAVHALAIIALSTDRVVCVFVDA